MTVDLKHARRKRLDLRGDEKPLPHSQEAEAGLLGCCLLDWRKLAVLEGAFGAAGEQAFYDLRHQAIYRAMLDLRDGGHEVEPVAVADRLKATGLLDQCGGMGYVLALCNATPSAENAPHFAAIVVEKRTLRELLALCHGMVAQVADYNGEVSELLDDFERKALAVGSGRVQSRDANIPEEQQTLIDDYEAAHRGQRVPGVMTHFENLDAIAGGMKPAELIVIGGNPSSGKTTLALCIVARAAATGTTVSFFSGETGARNLVHRLHCMEARVDGGVFMNGQPSERDLQRMAVGAGKVAHYRDRLLIDDGSLGRDLIAKARRHWQRGARLFVVDYLQLIDAPGATEFERVTNASKLGKRMAKELDSPVIFVSSLKRPEKGSSAKPKVADLRQSGQIEYDADKVLLLHVADDERDAAIRTVECHVAKHKDGPTGVCLMTMFASEFRMEPGTRGGPVEAPVPRETEDYAPDAR